MTQSRPAQAAHHANLPVVEPATCLPARQKSVPKQMPGANEGVMKKWIQSKSTTTPATGTSATTTTTTTAEVEGGVSDFLITALDVEGVCAALQELKLENVSHYCDVIREKVSMSSTLLCTS